VAIGHLGQKKYILARFVIGDPDLVISQHKLPPNACLICFSKTKTLHLFYHILLREEGMLWAFFDFPFAF
jgi:hypothetical protein